jgi:hypothetical protein
METHLYDAPDAQTALSYDSNSNGDEVYVEASEESGSADTGEEVYYGHLSSFFFLFSVSMPKGRSSSIRISGDLHGLRHKLVLLSFIYACASLSFALCR